MPNITKEERGTKMKEKYNKMRGIYSKYGLQVDSIPPNLQSSINRMVIKIMLMEEKIADLKVKLRTEKRKKNEK